MKFGRICQTQKILINKSVEMTIIYITHTFLLKWSNGVEHMHSYTFLSVFHSNATESISSVSWENRQFSRLPSGESEKVNKWD